MDKKIIRSDGYVLIYVPGHPNSGNGYVLEHRYIMEQKLGRYLEPDESVHHKDHNKQNNSIDNLELIKNSEHTRKHQLEKGKLFVKLRCPECGKEFEIPKNQSYLQKSNKYNCNCCTKECRGKLYRKIQLKGMTNEIKQSIDSCFIKEYRKYNI